MDPLFEKRMKELLQDDVPVWKESLEQPAWQGVRLSPLKQNVEKTAASLNFLEKPSPFAENAWYFHGHYGLHPAHLQGLIYFQEPSAGSAAELLEVQPDDLVLDLCAAPGSKSTQILPLLKDGMLVSNEIDPKRARILLSNMERMGAENFAVTSMDSKTLCEQMPGAFDRILVDAPCSGEGMMKKHDAARDEWSLPNVLLCAARQKDIVRNAWKALRPGGTMVYSTCTYAPEENEENVAWMLENLPGAVLDPVDVSWGRPGLTIGQPGETGYVDGHHVRRIFPMDGGEGHFTARLKKELPADSEQTAYAAAAKPKQKKEKGRKNTAAAKPDREAAAFLASALPAGGYRQYLSVPSAKGVKLYGMNHPFLSFEKGTVLRQGVLIGESLKNRFEPDHAFFMSRSAALDPALHTETTLEQMDRFVHGEQISFTEAQKKAGENKTGWRALCYQGIPYGFGKSDGSRITNKYPKGLRLLPASHVCGSAEEGSAQ